jgi:hypothetical protein
MELLTRLEAASRRQTPPAMLNGLNARLRSRAAPGIHDAGSKPRH